MRYATVCTGIDSHSVAWEPLGWKGIFSSEIDPFASAVLKYHWPLIPNYGDMNNFKEWPEHEFELICGGTPCQSFSIAGLRQGLNDPRGNLALVYLAIIDRYRPRWIIWENVPGVRSSWSDEKTHTPSPESARILRAQGLDPDDFEEVDQSHDFDCFIAALSELGYGCAWGSLDAQYFDLAQRRERVFLVGYIGDWRPPAAVLFDSESVSGHSEPERKKQQGITTGFAIGPSGSHQCEIAPTLDSRCKDGPIRNQNGLAVVHTIGAGKWADGFGTLRARENEGHEHLVINAAGGAKYKISDRASSIRAEDHGTDTDLVLSFNFKSGGDCRLNPLLETANTLQSCQEQAIMTNILRRLTPVECERLMGFTDHYTRIPWNGKPAEECPDGHRYRVLGNSIAVTVLNWIGKRIQQFEKINDRT